MSLYIIEFIFRLFIQLMSLPVGLVSHWAVAGNLWWARRSWSQQANNWPPGTTAAARTLGSLHENEFASGQCFLERHRWLRRNKLEKLKRHNLAIVHRPDRPLAPPSPAPWPVCLYYVCRPRRRRQDGAGELARLR